VAEAEVVVAEVVVAVAVVVAVVVAVAVAVVQGSCLAAGSVHGTSWWPGGLGPADWLAPPAAVPIRRQAAVSALPVPEPHLLSAERSFRRGRARPAGDYVYEASRHGHVRVPRQP